MASLNSVSGRGLLLKCQTVYHPLKSSSLHQTNSVLQDQTESTNDYNTKVYYMISIERIIHGQKTNKMSGRGSIQRQTPNKVKKLVKVCTRKVNEVYKRTQWTKESHTTYQRKSKHLGAQEKCIR